ALSQYREAHAAVERSLAIYRGLGDRARARLAVVQLGRIRASMGDYEHAGELIQAVLDEEGVDEETAADAAGMLGWARALQGRYDEGVELMRKCLDYHARCGNVRLRAQVLRRLHWADLSRGQYESAIALAQRAQKDFQAIGNLFGEFRILVDQARAAVAREDFKQALSQATEAARIAAELNCRDGLGF